MKNRIHLYLVPGILLVFSSCILPVNAQVTSTGTSPQVIFDDTDEDGFEWAFTGDLDFFRLFNVDSNGFLIDFDDQADMQLDMKPTTFQIQDQSSNDIFRVHRDAPLSLDIQSDGDVFFGNKIGIGTTTPAVDLDIKSAKPVIFFHDTTVGSADWIVGIWIAIWPARACSSCTMFSILRSTLKPSGNHE